MKIENITITLDELREAIVDYCYKSASSQPSVVFVESHDTVRLSIELRPGGLVEGTAFKHRTSSE